MTRPGRPNPVRDKIEDIRATRGTSAPGMIRRERAQAVADAFSNRPDLNSPLPVRSRSGDIQFSRIDFKEINSDTVCVEVWVGTSTDGPPHYRFFNPPTLARDSEGDIEIDGRRYREDPMAAIAEVILGSKK